MGRRCDADDCRAKVTLAHGIHGSLPVLSKCQGVELVLGCGRIPYGSLEPCRQFAVKIQIPSSEPRATSGSQKRSRARVSFSNRYLPVPKGNQPVEECESGLEFVGSGIESLFSLFTPLLLCCVAEKKQYCS